jgi:hypothetical protein
VVACSHYTELNTFFHPGTAAYKPWRLGMEDMPPQAVP